MLRDLEVNEIVAVDATYSADVDMATGMGVIKDIANKVATLPAAEVGTEIVFTQKARIPTGKNAARTIFSDYDEEFNTIKKDDKVVLYNYAYDNIFATDQYDTATLVAGAEGQYVAWGTNGKAKLATAGVDSRYKFYGLYNDAGHILARIYKTEEIGSN